MWRSSGSSGSTASSGGWQPGSSSLVLLVRARAAGALALLPLVPLRHPHRGVDRAPDPDDGTGDQPGDLSARRKPARGSESLRAGHHRHPHPHRHQLPPSPLQVRSCLTHVPILDIHLPSTLTLFESLCIDSRR